MIFLGIETSCDETSASLVENGTRVLSNIISSQVNVHAITGGVVPEVASRHHLESINAVIDKALRQANMEICEISAVAVTNRPGLIGALLVGVSAAKAIAYCLNKPLFPVHHIEAHIYANWLNNNRVEFPYICLVVSGGHTIVFLIRGHGSYEILGRTRDDAAGEAFDKSARVIGLSYPGGKEIDRIAKGGNSAAVSLPRAKLSGRKYDFSFSGLKTSVLYGHKDIKNTGISQQDWAASIQEAIVDVLVNNTLSAADDYGVANVALAGGVAGNSRLQQRMKQECALRGISFHCPDAIFCTDNAAMIAAAGFHLSNRSSRDISCDTIASESLA